MLKHKTTDGRRPRAVDSIAGNLDKHVEPFFGAGRDVRTIRRPDLESFKRHLHGLGLAPTTINNNLTAARAVLKYAWAIEEMIDAVPMVANVRVSPESKGRALTPEQVQALIDHVDPRAIEAKEWLLFLANTGLRKGEALAIEWAWVNWDARTISIPADARKGGRRQLVPVPLNDVALALLEARQQRERQPGKGRVWFQQKHDGARNSAAERAGLGRVRNHDLRHTFGSLAHAAGASLPDIRDLLGHTTMAMANRYAHSYQGRLAEVAKRIQVGVLGTVPGKRSKTTGNERKRYGSRRVGGPKHK